ncbi:hypothetical protein [Aeromonas caviae]|uniref:hypothetical protein n=1 Tax=Aeromonas caviae TaxID=648 RepID=UPI001CC4145E|nr:hypothetical protein [Aeromonas caviae]GJA47247.1 hypothetical protein KAM346_35360 [Aeromonas caviae]GJA48593.1 hypothetical protein KAM347_03840 [Aeromonas caviae]GJA57748.1 hypothetical protein KAM350_07410 [Aeromonas caviae]GJA66433.1 hypothetical protein KAM352_04090 [Aeromonas caviae]GJB95222.1 hypothetical protein KAM383_08020 [Aeromonas caviae]
MSEIDKLVSSAALAYLAARGNTFNHLGVQLPLTAELLALAIQNNIVGACLERGGGKQGREDALLMLRHMVAGETLTPLGAVLLDEMNKAFCADVRQMLDEGKDPMVELAIEQTRRATQ